MSSCTNGSFDPGGKGGFRWRRLRKGDLEQVLSIERASFRSPWSLRLFEQELTNPVARGWVAEIDGEQSPPQEGQPARCVVGYLLVWIVADEMHIMNLAAHPAFRRLGIGRMLMVRAVAFARGGGMARLVLEVRESNAHARGLYDSLGFRPVGKRPGYYSDTGEDALIMVRELSPPDERIPGAD